MVKYSKSRSGRNVQHGKGLGRFFRRVGRKIKKGAKKGFSAVRKGAAKLAKNKFIKATRRVLDAGLGSVPVVGQAYGLADLGLRGTRAAIKGKFGQFAKKELVQGLRDTAMEAVAPGSTLARDAAVGAAGATKALVTGKGASYSSRRRVARIHRAGDKAHRHSKKMVRR